MVSPLLSAWGLGFRALLGFRARRVGWVKPKRRSPFAQQHEEAEHRAEEWGLLGLGDSRGLDLAKKAKFQRLHAKPLNPKFLSPKP